MKLRVKINQQTFDVEVGDTQARPILATIEGETFEVWPEAAEAQAAPVVVAASAPVAAVAPVAARPAVAAPVNVDASKAVSAPIPGTIVGISVKEGAVITVGQELLTLEAMKMKNIIRATRAGTIAKIYVSVGDKVRHGQVMLEFAA